MKCTIDINKPGYSPTTKEVISDTHQVVQVMDCSKAITTVTSEHKWVHKTSTQLLEVRLDQFTTIGGQGVLGTKEHCGPTACQLTSTVGTYCAASPPTGLIYEVKSGTLDSTVIQVKTSGEAEWQKSPASEVVVTAGGGLCIRCTNKLAGYVYANKLTMIKEKATKCFTSLTHKDFTLAATGTLPFEYGWRGYDKTITTHAEALIDVWPGPPKLVGTKVKEEVLSWPFATNAEPADCPLHECKLYAQDCTSAVPAPFTSKFSIEAASPWKLKV